MRVVREPGEMASAFAAAESVELLLLAGILLDGQGDHDELAGGVEDQGIQPADGFASKSVLASLKAK